MTEDKKSLSKCKTSVDLMKHMRQGFHGGPYSFQSFWHSTIEMVQVTDFYKNLLPTTSGLKCWKSSTKRCLTIPHGNSNSSYGLAYVNNLRSLCTTVMLILF